MVSTSMVYGCIIDVFNTENISAECSGEKPRPAPGFPAFTALRSARAEIVADGDTCPGRCFAALPRNLAPLWGWMGGVAVAAFYPRALGLAVFLELIYIPYAG